MKILIATGIYPPALGGPAKYAYNLEQEWKKMGHKVKVRTFNIEHRLPKGISHLFYLLKIIPAVIWSDAIYILDTSAVGFPAVVASKIFFKKTLIRTGGDRLWEEYVERTGDSVLFKDFYFTERSHWTKKDQALFEVSKWTMRNASVLVFSTKWQRDIFTKAYELNPKNIHIVENYYGEKLPSTPPQERNFIAGTRKIKWKNLGVLEEVFNGLDAKLDLNNYPHDKFMERISSCYATILTSLGDISPNMILESIRYNKPFIVTEENGLMDRIGAIALTVNPKDKEDVRKKVEWLCKEENYKTQIERVKNFNFTHTWEEIAKETLNLIK